jgi:hypothetical protein
MATTRDVLRHARMLLNEGAFESGEEDPSETVGAGSRALIMNPLYPPDTIGSRARDPGTASGTSTG